MKQIAAHSVKTRIVKILPALAVCLFLALMIAAFARELFGRLGYELHEVWNWDSVLYYTVGHGLEEGKTPYLEMYENKPPMIFLLAALSRKLTGGYRLLNFLSAGAFLSMLVLPLLFAGIFWKRSKVRFAYGALVFLFTLGCSALFLMYSEERSGEVQIEAFGTSALLFALFFASFIPSEKAKPYSLSVVLTGVFFGIAAMFKEPFLVVGGVSVLLMCNCKKDFFFRLFMPMLYAGVTVLAVLLVSGAFVPYFTVYLNNMLFSHISRYGSPFERMFRLGRLFRDMLKFSFALPAAVIFCILAVAVCETAGVSPEGKQPLPLRAALKRGALSVLRLTAGLFAASFCVGLGGQYFNHHHIFAMPWYFALLMRSIQLFFLVFRAASDRAPEAAGIAPAAQTDETPSFASRRKQKRALPAVACLTALCCLLTAGFFARPVYRQNEQVIARIQTLKQDAAWLDDVLDRLGEDTYLWLGFNGYTPCALTRHLPSGPCFAQDSANFQNADGFFAQAFEKQLLGTNVLVVKEISLGVLTESTKKYIEENFTSDPPESIAGLESSRPETFEWEMFYRKEKASVS